MRSPTASDVIIAGVITKSFGDGRCFFRSFVKGMNVFLQNAQHDHLGLYTNLADRLFEQHEADSLSTSFKIKQTIKICQERFLMVTSQTIGMRQYKIA